MHYIFISENYLHSNHSLFYTEYTVILTFLFVVVLAFIRLKTIGFIVAIIPSYLMAVTSIRTITWAEYQEETQKQDNFGLLIALSPLKLLEFEKNNRNKDKKYYPRSAVRAFVRGGNMLPLTDILIKRPSQDVIKEMENDYHNLNNAHFENRWGLHISKNTVLKCDSVGELEVEAHLWVQDLRFVVHSGYHMDYMLPTGGELYSQYSEFGDVTARPSQRI